MKTLFAITFATVYGLILRALFGFLQNYMEIMSVAFIILAPVAIGFLTIRLIPAEQTTSRTAAFFKPWLTSLAILAITILFNIEGTICWVMIFPLFAILAGFGGILAYSFRKQEAASNKPDDSILDDWDNPHTLKLSLVLLLPVFIGLIEGDRTSLGKELTITEEIIIPATPTAVWSAWAGLHETAPGERQTSLANFMGFPKHVRTTLDTLAVGGKRMAFYEKGLYFEETIAQYEPERLLALDIKTDPHKIPPTVLDEHIVIGGKHIDLLQDVYQSEQLADGTTRLRLSSRFYINTPFNWYAGIWAKYLMADLLEGELELIKRRAIADAVK